jgi:hypothetical protein
VLFLDSPPDGSPRRGSFSFSGRAQGEVPELPFAEVVIQAEAPGLPARDPILARTVSTKFRAPDLANSSLGRYGGGRGASGRVRGLHFGLEVLEEEERGSSVSERRTDTAGLPIGFGGRLGPDTRSPRLGP